MGHWYKNPRIEITVAVICGIMLGFNIYVIITRKVYRTWSTMAILLSCSLLLLLRCAFFILFAIDPDFTANQVLLVNNIFGATGIFLVGNVTVALCWQWWRIAHLLD